MKTSVPKHKNTPGIKCKRCIAPIQKHTLMIRMRYMTYGMKTFFTIAIQKYSFHIKSMNILIDFFVKTVLLLRPASNLIKSAALLPSNIQLNSRASIFNRTCPSPFIFYYGLAADVVSSCLLSV